MNEHIQGLPKAGDMLTCAETGKAFTVVSEGCTMNYACNQRGDYFSNEGAYAREKRALLDRSHAAFGYVNQDGKRFTDWKGNTLGTIREYGESPSGFHGASIARFRVLDIYGQWWTGRGAGRGMCCTLRQMKTPKG